MANLIGKVFGDMADESPDKALAFTSMAAAAAGATAYFTASLQSSTPEVRALLGGFASQKAMEHEGMNSFLMQKGWFDPYEDPIQQLMTADQQAHSMVSQH